MRLSVQAARGEDERRRRGGEQRGRGGRRSCRRSIGSGRTRTRSGRERRRAVENGNAARDAREKRRKRRRRRRRRTGTRNQKSPEFLPLPCQSPALEPLPRGELDRGHACCFLVPLRFRPFHKRGDHLPTQGSGAAGDGRGAHKGLRELARAVDGAQQRGGPAVATQGEQVAAEREGGGGAGERRRSPRS